MHTYVHACIHTWIYSCIAGTHAPTYLPNDRPTYAVRACMRVWMYASVHEFLRGMLFILYTCPFVIWAVPHEKGTSYQDL